MVATADLSPISPGPAIAPLSGLAVATAATAPRPAADVAAIAARAPADVADLAEPAPLAEPPSALAAMVADAATRQESLAPLLADLAVAVNAAATPPEVRNLAAQILAAQAPLDAELTLGALISATRSSGVFLEARLAGALLNPESPAPVLQQDLKALLLQLAGELAPLVEAPLQKAGAPPRGRSLHASAETPPPPLAGGETAGQPAARPSFGPDVEPETLARTLQQEVDGALARIQLSQAASVEQAGETTRWLFEVPIATPAGTGVAQFEISRDGRGAHGEASEPGWRARFSVDASSSGPVHANVLLGHGGVRVVLTAEDEAARAELAAHQHELTRELAAEHGADVAVRIAGGQPSLPESAPGQLVDRRS